MAPDPIDQLAASLPLAPYRVTDALDLDDARAHVRRRFPFSDIIGASRGRFRLVSHHVDLDGVTLTASVTTGYATRTEGPCCHLLLPLAPDRSMGRATVGRTQIEAPPRHALLLPCSEAFDRAAGVPRMVLGMTEAILRERLAAWEGSHRPGPLTPFQDIDLAAGDGQRLWRALSFVTAEITALEAAPSLPILRAGYRDLLLSLVLSILPASVRDPEQGPARASAPWQVRRAEQWLEAHAAEPVRMEDLALALGVSLRTIQHAFRRSRGITPREFLKRCRLDLARRRLQAAEPCETVSMIALECGFGHFGDFARSYRTRFGELPSDTLRRR